MKFKIHPIVRFILLVFSLNFLLFIPQYVVYNDMWWNLPKSGFVDFDKFPVWNKILIRQHFDIFRINCEFFILLWLGILLIQRNQKTARITTLLTSIYSIIFFYLIYYEFSFRLYGAHPSFYNDYFLLKDVVPLFVKEIGIVEQKHIIIYATILIVLLSTFYAGFHLLVKSLYKINFQRIKYHTYSTISIFVILGMVGYYLFPNEGWKNAWKTVQWVTPKIVQSIQSPAELSAQPKPSRQDGKNDKLIMQKKPDVYLLFIESYGSVAFHSEYQDQHVQLVKGLNQELKSQGWGTVSTFSRAPIIGGRSWLSFTSVLTGLNIESQIQYDYLLNHPDQYSHLVHWFHDQGYTTYRMKTMSDVKQSTSKLYQRTGAFFDFDHWIQYGDFNYQGTPIDPYFGGIPDQYAMNYLSDQWLSKSSLPSFTFFINMNSHMPWTSPPPIVEDYCSLDTIHFQHESNAGDDLLRYHRSLKYVLEVMQKFILETQQLNPESLFVLIGDHQPPTLDHWVEGKVNRYAVPIHIVSRDSDLLDYLECQGFEQGWIPDSHKPVDLKHYEFKNLLINSLVDAYGL